MTDAPERIYLDGDVEAGDGMFPRCFEDPKYASEPQVEYVRADRIEQLVATNEELTKERDDYANKLMQANNTYTEMHLEIERLSDKLATCGKYRDAYAELDRIGTQAVRELEAKLAKAVDAINVATQHEPKGLYPDHVPNYWLLRATLAAIKAP